MGENGQVRAAANDMSTGRQREFDAQKALREAMLLFWQKGYMGASLAELCDVMGINKPSMYAAFGNKENLFLAATDVYMEEFAAPQFRNLEGDGALIERIRAYMLAVVQEQCSSASPDGCYVSLCVSESASQTLPSDAAAKVEHVKNLSLHYLTDFFEREKKAGHIKKSVDATTLAGFILSLMHGMASMARGGARFEQLAPVLEIGLSAVGTHVSK